MEKFKVKSWANAHRYQRKGEVNNKPSLTVPDQTMSLRELLHRHTRGLPLHHVERPTYYDESETLDIRTLDLVDIQDMKDNVTEEINTLSKKLQNTRKKKGSDPSPQPNPSPQPKTKYKEQELPLNETGEADKPK